MIRVHGETAFEDAIEARLLDSGWLRGAASHYDGELSLDTAELFAFLGASQPRQWDRLRDLHGDPDEAQAAFAQRVATEIDRRGVLDVLRHGVKDRGVAFELAYFRPAHAIATDALERYATNRLTVTRQLHYSTAAPEKSLDLVLFVNGIPVATAELKNPYTNQTVEHAKHQYRHDRDPDEMIFARRTLVHFAVDPDLVFITTRPAGEQTRFLPFNTGSEGPGASGGAGNPPIPPDAPAGTYRTSYLWERVWQPDAWLDLLRRFVHLEDDTASGNGRRRPAPNPHRQRVIFPRFHQWHAVLTLADDAARHGAGRNYLVMHSAGSGKSNTIAWLAHRLSTLHTPADPAQLDPGARDDGLAPDQPVYDKVVVVTDRRVLDRQLQRTVYQFEHTPGVVERIDQHSSQLADALQSRQARIVITTLQKFPYVLHEVHRLVGTRFAVVVDEAHSSQGGEAVKDLKRVLARLGTDEIDEDGDPLTAAALARGAHPNLSFFAFTATPKPKTLELFGVADPVTGNPRPFHVYSMRQAIEEGFILDVLRNYVTYDTYYRLANANADDREVETRRARAQLARFADLHPSSLAQRAEVVVEHFRANVVGRMGGRAKAMVVTRSREHAVRMFWALREYVATLGYRSCEALVAFSGAVRIDDVDYTEAGLNGFGEGELPARFGYTAADDPHAGTPAARYDREYRILVVAEKYQTGFDQPLLTTMYVDKPLKGVAAVQTLSRLNRTHPLKSQDDVFVLDFANEAEDVQREFRAFYETAITAPTDPNLLYIAADTVRRFEIVDDGEMAAFAEAYLALPEPERQGAHAELYRLTEPACRRYAELDGEDPAGADEFRSALRRFSRMYAFLAQIMPLPDPDLERLHVYGRYLLTRLPRRDDPGVDIGQVQLTHLRTTRTGEHDLALAPEGEQALPGFTGGGAGPTHDPGRRPLSELIDEFNQRVGGSLTEGDRVWAEQQIVAATEHGDIQQAALVNDEDNFAVVFDRYFEDVVLNRHDDNGKLMRRYLDDENFRHYLTRLARREAYRLARNKVTDDPE